MSHYLDKDYLNYISNKKVALVGPASYLLREKMGSLIDSYDIVVRVGRSLEILPNYPKNLGSKTNILYNSCIEHPDQGGELNIPLFKSQGVEWISTIPASDYNGSCASNNLPQMVTPSSIEKIKQNFNFHITDWRICSAVNSSLDCRANTGFVGIFDLLYHQIKELFICGYSFYLDPYINGYKKGCTEIEADNVRRISSTRHIQENHWRCLKEEVSRNWRIKVDPFLKKILNMNSYSLDNFKKIS